MARTRTLHNPSTGKLWATRTEGTHVTIVSGSPGKQKEALKPQKDELSTKLFLRKEEGAQLRKGLVLHNPDAPPGEPIMLRHLARGFTGALAIAEHQGKLLVNQFNDALKGDELWLVARDGSGGPIAAVGSDRLVGQIVPAGDRFLLRVDSQIQSWDPRTQAFDELTPRTRERGALLDCARETAAWFHAPEIVVRDVRAGVDRLRLAVTLAPLSGGALQCAAALSLDGETLAVCVDPHEITLHDVTSGSQKGTLVCPFEAVQQVAFTPDGRHVLVKEQLGTRMLAFDLEAGSAVGIGDDLGPDANDFAVDAVRGRLAVFAYGTTYIYDLATKKKQRELELDQTARSVNMLWTHDGLLATHSDLGCVGLYRV